MSESTPHTLLTRASSPGDCLKSMWGFEADKWSKRWSIAGAVAYFIHELGVPAVTAGTRIGGKFNNRTGQFEGGRLYEADHFLTLGYNLFDEDVEDNAETRSEPVLVGFLSDNSRTNLTSPGPSPFGDAVVTVSVRGVTTASAQNCAWALWSVFRQEPPFSVSTQHGCLDPSVPTETFLDLVVQKVAPLNEPQVVERQPNSKVHVAFSITARYARTRRGQASC